MLICVNLLDDSLLLNFVLGHRLGCISDSGSFSAMKLLIEEYRFGCVSDGNDRERVVM